METAETITALLEAIKFFREQYFSSAYSTMGFTIISAGWLITSQSARVFLHSHRWLGMSAIIMLILTYIGYWEMSLGVQALSQGISNQLMLLGVDKVVFEHYELSIQGVYGFIFLQGLALVFTSLIIIAILKDPGQE